MKFINTIQIILLIIITSLLTTIYTLEELEQPIKGFIEYHTNFFDSYSKELLTKMTVLSKSINNFPFLTVEGQFLKNYILTHEYKMPGVSRDDFKNIQEQIKKFVGKPDGTYDLLTGEIVTFDSGYQTTFVTYFDKYTDKEFDEMVYKFAIMTNGMAYLGVWENTPEISFLFEDYEVAMAIAVSFNQMTVWDWKNNEIINNLFFKQKKKNLR